MDNEILWDKLAHQYDNQYHAITDWRLGYLVVEELLGDVTGKRILDYGCGSGKFSRRLHDLGANVIGVDISNNAILQARAKGGNIEYMAIQKDDVSFIEKESLDAAVANFVFCTMQTDEQIKGILQQIYDKMNPGAYLIICEPHPLSLGYEYVSMRREKPKCVKSRMPIKVSLTGMDTKFNDYWRSTADYVSLLERPGFEINAIKEPIIEDCPGEHFWKDERIQAPLLIIRAKKVLPFC